jgi:hypothetical protein
MRLTLTTDFLSFVYQFFALQGEKLIHKNGKYHAAAGENCFVRKFYIKYHATVRETAFV